MTDSFVEMLLLITAAFLALTTAQEKFVIPGTGCGNVQNSWQTIAKLPEDITELDQLSCVLTNDQEGFERWKATRTQWTWTTQWSDCSVTCGGGIQFRIRECRNATHVVDESNCAVLDPTDVSLNRTRRCNDQDCLPCAEFSLAYAGVEIGTAVTVTWIDECGELCRQNPDCAYYRYNVYDKTCKLYSSREASPIFSSSLITAPRHCRIQQNEESKK